VHDLEKREPVFGPDHAQLKGAFAPLIARPLSVHIAAGRRELGTAMEGKARFIFPVVITAIIVFVVSAVVTFTNIGFRADFVARWLKAFITGWPVAAVTAFVAIPYARRVTTSIAGLLDRKA